MVRFRPEISVEVHAEWAPKSSITVLRSDGAANVIASTEPVGAQLTSEEYAGLQGSLLRDEFPGYIEELFGPSDAFGQKGFVRKFSWDPPSGQPVTQVQIYFALNGRGFLATSTVLKADYPRLEAEVLAILKSVRIELGP